MLENIIGVEEAAKLWGLSSGYIKNLCAEGKLVCKKIGRTWVLDKNQPNPKIKEENKVKQLNYTMMHGKKYQLPAGYYAIDGRFGDQVYNERGENVTSKIMGNAKRDGYIINTDKGIEDLEVMESK